MTRFFVSDCRFGFQTRQQSDLAVLPLQNIHHPVFQRDDGNTLLIVPMMAQLILMKSGEVLESFRMFLEFYHPDHYSLTT